MDVFEISNHTHGVTEVLKHFSIWLSDRQSHSGSPELLYMNRSSGNLVFLVLMDFVGAVSVAGVKEEMGILM